jgi:hypothetical protein
MRAKISVFDNPSAGARDAGGARTPGVSLRTCHVADYRVLRGDRLLAQVSDVP